MDIREKEKLLELLDKVADAFDEYRGPATGEDHVFWEALQELYNLIDETEWM